LKACAKPTRAAWKAVLLRQLRSAAPRQYRPAMGRHIRIHTAAPAKPPLGAACNGCGLCCLAEPCPLGMIVSMRMRGACRALRWDGVRYRCGVMRRPLLRRLVGRWIAAGRGCDSSAETG
jgi:hypothetical protein